MDLQMGVLRPFFIVMVCLLQVRNAKEETRMKEMLQREGRRCRLLLESVPAPLTVLFVFSVVAMNLLANKSIDLPVDYLALDCGIVVSWVSFLSMDMLTRRFGPGAATRLSVMALGFNLLCCLIFFAGSALPGTWGESYVPGSEAVINTALDHTFGGTWYVLAGSSLAFLVSAAVNNFANYALGRTRPGRGEGFGAYALRSYLSTALGQFVDNLTFALVVSHNFFGWSLLQCVTCALTGMGVELLCEVVFSPVGYRVCRRWQEQGVGAAYLKFEEEMGR